jgi:GDP/UDP-N,N'-diacetylbacillosamine 2-epimerase (hydrolysing)
MSHLHFVSTEVHHRRVVQLGESPERVFNVGALGVDNVLGMELMSREDVEKELGRPLGSPTLLVSFHPVTLEPGSAESHFAEVLAAIDQFPEASVFFTEPNADPGSAVIREQVNDYVRTSSSRAFSSRSLGSLLYLSLMREADVVVGNSSSGIIEAPSMGTPTVDVGSRQRGRMRANSVIHVEPVADAVAAGISRALESDFARLSAEVQNPYGDGRAAGRIVDVLKSRQDLLADARKEFHDLA